MNEVVYSTVRRVYTDRAGARHFRLLDVQSL